MKIVNFKIFIASIFFLLLSTFSYSQENTTVSACDQLLNSGYVSNGQEYKAKVDENNKARFYTTFYGGSYYRVIACSDNQKYPLIFSVFDTEKNLLFSNKDHQYTSYWNFTFTSTIDCIIELELKSDKPLTDEVMLLIGFKEK
ncbi:MAG: hypothetical protein V2I54_03750 [Bacteroidales bacterium]|jgi:hypothetical protein|nr:hypothetical protein [Bacteroidales bacterium]